MAQPATPRSGRIGPAAPSHRSVHSGTEPQTAPSTPFGAVPPRYCQTNGFYRRSLDTMPQLRDIHPATACAPQSDTAACRHCGLHATSAVGKRLIGASSNVSWAAYLAVEPPASSIATWAGDFSASLVSLLQPRDGHLHQALERCRHRALQDEYVALTIDGALVLFPPTVWPTTCLGGGAGAKERKGHFVAGLPFGPSTATQP